MSQTVITFNEYRHLISLLDKLRVQNAELRVLVGEGFGYAYAGGIKHKSEKKGLVGPEALKCWYEWAAKHPALMAAEAEDFNVIHAPESEYGEET